MPKNKKEVVEEKIEEPVEEEVKENNKEVFEPVEENTEEVSGEEEVAAPKRGRYEEEEEVVWIPKTELGRLAEAGKITIEDIFNNSHKIKEAEIVDKLVPNLEEEIIYIGGSPGKGGGIQRSAVRRTVRIHKSGKRMSLSAMVIVGNRDGYLGVGFGKAVSNKEAIKKAAVAARKNLFPVRRGCGSGECKCEDKHSIPFAITGKKGSVQVKLMPAPRGLSLCAPDEIKKVFRLAGIRDIRMKSSGQTGSRINFIYAVENALRNLNQIKL